MTKRKKRNGHSKSVLITIGVVVVVLAAIVWTLFFHGMSKGGERYIYISPKDNIDSVYSKLRPITNTASFQGFRILASVTGYADHIRSGRYSIDNTGALFTFRNFKNGHQASVHLTVPSMHLMSDLGDVFAKKMQFTKKEFMDAATDSLFLDSLGYKPSNIIAVFIPNTYDFYWDISPCEFIRKMTKNYDKFWTPARQQKAKPTA